MSVSNTTNTGFFKSIGNWFNKNGDTLGKSMQLAGTTAMGVGVMAMGLRAMGKPSHGCGGSIWGGGFGGCCSPWSSMMSPWNMGGCGMFGGMSMFNNMSTMTNPYLTMMGMQSASNYGYMNAMASRQNMYTSSMYNNSFTPYMSQYSALNNWSNNTSLTDTEYTDNSNKVAGLSSEEKTNTEKGQEMDETFGTLTNSSGAAVSGKKYTYAASGATAAEKSEALQTSAKSFIAYVDKEDGDGDGFVDEDEFVQHETGHGTDSQLRQVFQQFDLNGDKNLDWKEYSALLRTYDYDNNGEISSKEFADAQRQSAANVGKGDNDVFRTRIVRSYKKEFGSDSI